MNIKVFRKEGVYNFDLRGWILYGLYQWSVNRDGYLYRKQGGKNKLFHRQILEAPDRQLVDHIDGNVRNNHPNNLRFCTKAENAWNIPIKSRYKGVKVRGGRYQARMSVNGKNLTLGTFDSLRDAIIAYNEAAVLYRGEFAVLHEVPDA